MSYDTSDNISQKAEPANSNAAKNEALTNFLWNKYLVGTLQNRKVDTLEKTKIKSVIRFVIESMAKAADSGLS